MTHATQRKLIGVLIAVTAAVLALAAFTSPTHAAGSATMSVIPMPGFSVTLNQDIDVVIQQNANVVTTAAQSDLNFNQAKLQVTDVQLGPAWAGASFLIGVAPQTKAQAIAEANTTGRLKNIAAYFAPGGSTVPAGQTVFATVKMHAIASSGPVPLTLTNSLMSDSAGSPVIVTVQNSAVYFFGDKVGGVVETLTGSGLGSGGFPTLTVILGALAVAVVVGGGITARRGFTARKS
jgi:hypothetical protein